MSYRKATTTIGIVLKYGHAPDTLTELCKIKSFPQIKGERERVDSTDMTDSSQTHEPAVQEVPTMSFRANFLVSEYLEAQEDVMRVGYFELVFGKDGGAAAWQGRYDMYLNEGEVNGLAECTIVCYPTTEIYVLSEGTETGKITLTELSYLFEDTSNDGDVVLSLGDVECVFTDENNDGEIIITESEVDSNG